MPHAMTDSKVLSKLTIIYSLNFNGESGVISIPRPFPRQPFEKLHVSVTKIASLTALPNAETFAVVLSADGNNIEVKSSIASSTANATCMITGRQ